MAKTKTTNEEDLAAQVAAELEGDDSMTKTATKATKKNDADSLKGKSVTFQAEDDKGKRVDITGTVTGPGTDEGTVKIKGEDGETYQAAPDDLTINDAEEAPEEPTEETEAKPATAKKGGKKKDAAPEAVVVTPGTMIAKPIKIADIKIPPEKELPRGFTDDEKFKEFTKDIKHRGVRVPIRLMDRDTKPTLVEGRRRIEACKILGITEIPAFDESEIKDSHDRLYYGLLDNEMRQEMHWIELAGALNKLCHSGKEEYNQKKVGKAFGINETALSKMLNVLNLPKEILAYAKREPGEEPVYSLSLFQELAAAQDDKEVLNRVLAAMKASENLGSKDVRRIRADVRKEAQAKAKEKGEEGPKDPKARGAKSAPSAGLLHEDVPKEDCGPGVKIRIYNDSVQFNIEVPWTKKQFKDLNILEAIEACFDANFKNEEKCRSRSMEALLKTMSSVKVDLSARSEKGGK